MLIYCLKYKKNAKTVDSKVLKANTQTNKQTNKMVEQLYYQNVLHMVVESEKTRSKRNIK